MTAAEYLALPDPPPLRERRLIRGVVFEGAGGPFDRPHSTTAAELAGVLGEWCRARTPRFVGTARVDLLLAREPDTCVTADLTVSDPGRAAVRRAGPTGDPVGQVWHGPPTLCVEIRSAADTDEELGAKTDAYLDAGVPVVWEVCPAARSVTVHRPGADPRMVSGDQTLDGEPDLPGFAVRCSELFGD